MSASVSEVYRIICHLALYLLIKDGILAFKDSNQIVLIKFVKVAIKKFLSRIS